ncbi:hypothetical protein GGI20_005314 [Coemansia sp. BCRC 34301]|nr:hypothetical protein GGI20_005314 [Coemansia sp. BCRC 34301]
MTDPRLGSSAPMKRGFTESLAVVTIAASLLLPIPFLSALNRCIANSDDSSTWTPLVSLPKPYPITIEGHVEKPFCFRVVFYAPASPATAFDLLANILRRTEWDELTESTEILQHLAQGDAIHYVKMKAIWPTAARDSVLISRIKKTKHEDEDAFLNVSQSIEDSRVPEKHAEGIVRMEAALAGQIVTNASREDRARLGLDGEHWCKVTQIADGDMKGWIPKSVLKFVATQALPRSLAKVCRQLAATQSRQESLLLRRLEEVEEMPVPKAVVAMAPAPPVAAAPVVRVGRATWLGWTRVLVRYATPAVIAALTSLVFHFYMRRRRS